MLNAGFSHSHSQAHPNTHYSNILMRNETEIYIRYNFRESARMCGRCVGGQLLPLLLARPSTVVKSNELPATTQRPASRAKTPAPRCSRCAYEFKCLTASTRNASTRVCVCGGALCPLGARVERLARFAGDRMHGEKCPVRALSSSDA